MVRSAGVQLVRSELRCPIGIIIWVVVADIVGRRAGDRIQNNDW